MPGIVKGRNTQFGRETTAGTIVVATTTYRGKSLIDDQREVIFVDENIAITPGTDRSYISKFLAEIAMDTIEATFEQLPHFCEMGIRTVAGVQDATGSGYAYAYTLPHTVGTGLPPIKTYTIEGGDNQQAEVVEYCFATEIKLEGNVGEAWMMSATIQGRQVANQAFTGSVAIPSVEEILFGKTKLYIDAEGGTIGTTQVLLTLLAASFTFTTGLQAQWTADGDLFFSFAKDIGSEAILELTLEHNASAVTEKTNWRNQVARLIRLEALGSALTTPIAETNKRMTLDLAGKWSDWPSLDDQDGDDVYTVTFTGRYNSTAALYGVLEIVNELSSLP